MHLCGHDAGARIIITENELRADATTGYLPLPFLLRERPLDALAVLAFDLALAFFGLSSSSSSASSASVSVLSSLPFAPPDDALLVYCLIGSALSYKAGHSPSEVKAAIAEGRPAVPPVRGDAAEGI